MHRRDVVLLAGTAGLFGLLRPRLTFARETDNAAAATAMWQGINSVTGAAKSTAVQGTTKTQGGFAAPHVTVCDSIFSFRKAIEIQASATVGLGQIGVSAKADYAESLDIDELTTTVVARAVHSPGTITFTNVKATPEVEKYLNTLQGSEEEFAYRYGDAWISSITNGGEYIASYLFHSSTREEKKSLESSLSTVGGQLDASFRHKLETVSKTTNKSSDLKQLITGFIDPPPLPEPDKISEFALKFGSLRLTSPTVLSFKTALYDSVPGLAKAFPQVKTARVYFLGSPNAGLLEETDTGLMKERQILIGKRTALQHIVRAGSRYGFPVDASIKKNGAIFDADLRAINAQIDGFTDNPAQTFKRPNLPSKAIGTPALLIKLPPTATQPKFGGGGRQFFNDAGDPLAAVLSGIKADSIRLRYWQPAGSYSPSFAGLETTFSYPEPDRPPKVVVQGTNEVKAGSLEWTDYLRILDDPLAAIECRHNPGKTLLAVRLRTRDGQSIETPFEDDQTFALNSRLYGVKAASWTLPPGEVFLGFAGAFNGMDPSLLSELQLRTCSYRGVKWV